MWFDNVAASENPGREELHMFVCDLRNFFAYCNPPIINRS